MINKLISLKDKLFFIVESNKIITINENQIEFIYFFDNQPISVKNEKVIDERLIN